MSLIPSESTSFPDLLGRGLGASKKSKWRVPSVQEVKPEPDSSSRVAPAKTVPPVEGGLRSNRSGEKSRPVSVPPVDRPVPAVPAVEQSPVAPPPVVIPEVVALEVVAPEVEPLILQALTPELLTPVEPAEEVPVLPIPIVPIARSKSAGGPNPVTSQSSVPAVREENEKFAPASRPTVPPPRTPSAKPRLRPRPTLQPRFETVEPVAPMELQQPAAPAPVLKETASIVTASTPPLLYQPAASAEEGEEFGFPDSPMLWPNLQRRRRIRLIRFVVYELVALAVLVSSAMVGLSHRLPDDPLSFLTKILTIISAVAVAVVPIIFYGLPETLPRSRR